MNCHTHPSHIQHSVWQMRWWLWVISCSFVPSTHSSFHHFDIDWFLLHPTIELFPTILQVSFCTVLQTWLLFPDVYILYEKKLEIMWMIYKWFGHPQELHSLVQLVIYCCLVFLWAHSCQCDFFFRSFLALLFSLICVVPSLLFILTDNSTQI